MDESILKYIKLPESFTGDIVINDAVANGTTTYTFIENKWVKTIRKYPETITDAIFDGIYVRKRNHYPRRTR